MTYDALGPKGLDYLPCRYGASKVLFRGPRRSLEAPYLAFLGSTETYGKFISSPFPHLVEQDIGVNCINFGCLNAGIDVFTADQQLQDIAASAQVTVIQAMGAQNMSNRFYSVHPRRNDRFVKPSVLLQAIYREVDFAEFSFNKHMLGRLLTISPERFETVVSELQQAWVGRMSALLRSIPGQTVLFWFADHSPDETFEPGQECDPWYVNREMINEVRAHASAYVEVTVSPEARASGTEGMIFDELEIPAAKHVMGPAAHHEASVALSACLRGMV